MNSGHSETAEKPKHVATFDTHFTRVGFTVLHG